MGQRILNVRHRCLSLNFFNPHLRTFFFSLLLGSKKGRERNISAIENHQFVASCTWTRDWCWDGGSYPPDQESRMLMPGLRVKSETCWLWDDAPTTWATLARTVLNFFINRKPLIILECGDKRTGHFAFVRSTWKQCARWIERENRWWENKVQDPNHSLGRRGGNLDEEKAEGKEKGIGLVAVLQAKSHNFGELFWCWGAAEKEVNFNNNLCSQVLDWGRRGMRFAFYV